jgi:hypothetical protein
MTAVQQYWHIRAGGAYASQRYPLPAGLDGFQTAAVSLLGSRVLSYRDPPPEGFLSSVAPIAARLSASPRLPLPYQPPEGFASTVQPLSAAVVQYTRITLAPRPAEGFASAMQPLSAAVTHYTRVLLDDQTAEGFSSTLLLAESESVSNGYRLRTQEAEGFATGVLHLISGAFGEPPDVDLGPNDFDLRRARSTDNNFNLAELR